MHDVLGRVKDPISLYLPSLSFPCNDVLGRVGDPISLYLPSLAFPCNALCRELRIPYLCIYPTWTPDLSTNHWKPDIETLKVNYREKMPLVKDRSLGIRLSGGVLWGPLIPAPMVITSMLLALYSILTIY